MKKDRRQGAAVRTSLRPLRWPRAAPAALRLPTAALSTPLAPSLPLQLHAGKSKHTRPACSTKQRECIECAHGRSRAPSRSAAPLVCRRLVDAICPDCRCRHGNCGGQCCVHGCNVRLSVRHWCRASLCEGEGKWAAELGSKSFFSAGFFVAARPLVATLSASHRSTARRHHERCCRFKHGRYGRCACCGRAQGERRRSRTRRCCRCPRRCLQRRSAHARCASEPDALHQQSQ